jgi:glutathione peroxidase
MIYDFYLKNIDGKEIKLEEYKEKVLLIVNVASKCGFTPQYKDLEEISQKYKEKGLLVLGFPANEFGQQEPGTNPEIKEFCSLTYKVDFPLFEKICVKGDAQHPLFNYLTKAKNPDFTGEIKWNFEKFLIGRDGQLLRRFRSKVKPTDEEIVDAIEQALNSH